MNRTKVEYLKDSYAIDIRVGLLATIVLFILAFLLIPRIEVEPYQLTKPIETIVLPSDVQILDVDEPPVKELPKIPVATDDPSNADAGTIAPTNFDDLVLNPNHDVSLAVVPFYKVEVKPKLIKSFPPEYPPLAKQLGQEGSCVVEAIIGTDGHVKSAEIIKSTDSDLLDRSAIAAVMQYRFTPGIQRDKPVEVRVSIPIRFSLH